MKYLTPGIVVTITTLLLCLLFKTFPSQENLLLLAVFLNGDRIICEIREQRGKRK